ncbi:MAG: hypothetical protein P8Y78_10745, partial [Acidihalobacter sp.]
MSAKPHRNTIHVEDSEILAHHAHEAEQYVLRVHAPRCAARAEPGSFAHLTCDPQLPLRRPLSIMRTDSEAGWVEFLYKAVGRGTSLLARRKPGQRLSVMGPIGTPFTLHPERRRPVLIGEKVVATATVTGKNAPTMTIQLKTEVVNAEGQIAVSGSARVK